MKPMLKFSIGVIVSGIAVFPLTYILYQADFIYDEYPIFYIFGAVLVVVGVVLTGMSLKDPKE